MVEKNGNKIPILDDNLEDDLNDEALSEILSQNDFVEKRPKSQMGSMMLNENSHVLTKKYQNENQKLKQEIMKLKEDIFRASQIKPITLNNLEDNSQLMKSFSRISGKSGRSDYSMNIVNNALNVEQQLGKMKIMNKQFEKQNDKLKKNSQENQNLFYSILLQLMTRNEK